MMKAYEILGANIQRQRRLIKMRQEELATHMGLSRTSISNIESGRQRVLIHDLYTFAAVLKCSPSDLLPEAIVKTTIEFIWSQDEHEAIKSTEHEQSARGPLPDDPEEHRAYEDRS